MEETPSSLPSSSQPTTVVRLEQTPPASVPASPASTTHTFYKPRATSTASARRSRTESLTNSVHYPPSSSRPQSLILTNPPSTTHTGSILPPAPFFHPAKPISGKPQAPPLTIPDIRAPPLNANNVYAPARVSVGYTGGGTGGGRPSSGISTSSSTMGGVPLISSTSSHAREHGLIMLPLSNMHSHHSDGSNSGPDVSSYSDSSQRRRFSAHSGPTTRIKPSREQLLPIGEKESSSVGKTSGVRVSLERMFRRTTSSERERSEVRDTKDRIIMDDHARAASSLSVRMRRQDSTQQPPTPKETLDIPEEEPGVAPAVAFTTKLHPVPRPLSDSQKFQGKALDGWRKNYGPERHWQIFPSRNTFFLNGRLLTGGDSPLAFIFSLTVVFAIAGVWFGTTCVWWWTHESPAVAAVGVYMCLLTIASMLATVSWSDVFQRRDFFC